MEGFATGRGQQELVLELINNKPGEGGEIDGLTTGRCDQTSRKLKTVMLGWGEISHSEMECLLFAQRDDQFGWLVFSLPPVFGFTNQGIQETLRSYIQGRRFSWQSHNQIDPTRYDNANFADNVSHYQWQLLESVELILQINTINIRNCNIVTSVEIAETPQKPLSCWPLAFSVGLLGVGQNGLLVAIPVLVIQTSLSLSIWAALLMLGSMLFLPSSPWWGKQITRVGSKPVVLWALGGYSASFTLLGLGCVLMATDAVTTAVGLGILIIARIVYGLTVSAMVPACQVWALQRAGKENRMTALATISSGLSCGRLFGPLCAAAMLAIHPLAPIGLLMAAPLLALLMLLRLPGMPPQPAAERKSARLRLNCLPYLLCALLLAAAVSMMQLGLSPALTRQFATDTAAISHQIAWLLGLAAVAALIAQFGVLRPQRLTPMALLLSAGALMISGLAIMIAEQLWLFYLGCAALSFGAALATPAYQLLLNDKLTDGAGAGWIATSHTLGYGLCALLVPLVSKTGTAAALIMAALFVAVLFTVVSGFIWRSRYRSQHSAI
ncbi:transposon function, ShiF, putative [Salmonella enterica subsp. arizonae]|uniref:Transposon function, ShiF, putative n=1 Tax=Salmonella enterica subsp. arizonae TaxID=59203 RepID=A0A3S5DGA0_SALER|nr:transposon function, ShiF, putative [Salmonella enterica subsp. arizonae]